VITTIKSYLFPNVDNITAGLNSMSSRLAKLANSKKAAAVVLREEAERTHAAADALVTEADRALRAAGRIAKLVA
jgi:hypothetical protein